ncbi:hypothetical protein IGI04_028593 [Brassica rapa subsp. trilocularis]|uniref:non-specific serine/threonine protein kinase n=1 Tax=Brassica rapa subsp. trilocularis TaxID=1813537 RepID=A0ABQ7L689_BRACM|nr:hypothetical protein IGI04_028593 [Brassica rapa subsp. trilocularis]
MSDSPSSSPPAPSSDSTPPPDNSSGGGSAPPPTDSAPPPSPPADSTPPPDNSTGGSAPPPADSAPPPTPPSDSSSPPPATPPPESNPPPDSPPPPPPDAPPPADHTPVDSGSPPPEPTNSPPPPPPPEESEPPPPPPNEEDSSPPQPPPEKSSPPPSEKSSPPPPEKSSPPPSEKSSPPPPEKSSPPPASSPKSAPKKKKKSPPPPPPGAPTKSPSNAPPPLNAPHALPPKSTSAGGPLKSPSTGVPSFPPPPPNGNDNGYQGKTMAGMAVAGFAIIAVVAVLFFVRRKKKRNVDAYSDSQYMPPPNFSIQSDGLLHGQNTTRGYSVPGGYNTQQQSYNTQQQSDNTRTSFGSQRGYPPDSAVMGSGQTHFTYEELMDITEGFAQRNILGEGGFGCVYKGKLHDGKLVAVKQLKVGSGQGDREFKAEVEIISRVHHRHLVSLVGYCISDVERLLIYEYVPNQTLEHHLHGKGRPVLEWAKRVRIAIGSAKGLAYLHEDCHPKIIHRDIKQERQSSSFFFNTSAVADFGLAKLNDSTQTHVSTRVMGTFGYLAPEYAQSGKLTDRSDVFSFGVVLLELVTGRKPVDQYQPLGEESLVEWARPLLHKAIETGDFSDLVDRRLQNHYVENEVFRMIETAAACIRHSGPKRPRMAQVVRALDSEGDMGDISNGSKVGQTSSYDSGQYNSDAMKFRKMAFGFDDSSDSGDYSVRSSSRGSYGASTEFTRNESENRKFNNRQY